MNIVELNTKLIEAATESLRWFRTEEVDSREELYVEIVERNKYHTIYIDTDAPRFVLTLLDKMDEFQSYMAYIALYGISVGMGNSETVVGLVMPFTMHNAMFLMKRWLPSNDKRYEYVDRANELYGGKGNTKLKVMVEDGFIEEYREIHYRILTTLVRWTRGAGTQISAW